MLKKGTNNRIQSIDVLKKSEEPMYVHRKK